MSDPLYPFSLFRFEVEFHREDPARGAAAGRALCRGAFSEITGLEATMEPRAIKCGGANYGPFQRAGPVTFGTVILKRGVTTSRDLWTWFSRINQQGRTAIRLDVVVKAFGEVEPAAPPGDPDRSSNPSREPRLTVQIRRALPVKFKAGDFNARSQEVAVEELHLVHEGLTIS